jgi:hypothetical protein
MLRPASFPSSGSLTADRSLCPWSEPRSVGNYALGWSRRRPSGTRTCRSEHSGKLLGLGHQCQRIHSSPMTSRAVNEMFLWIQIHCYSEPFLGPDLLRRVAGAISSTNRTISQITETCCSPGERQFSGNRVYQDFANIAVILLFTRQVLWKA